MKTKTIFAAIIGLNLLAPLASFAAAGSTVYDKTCALCHAAGVAGAPKLGNKGDWTPRIAKGVNALYTSALNGTAKGMPAKGGNPALSDADVKAAVDFMVSKVATAKQEKPAAKDTKAAAKEAAKPAAPVAAPVAVTAAAAPAPTADVAVNTAAGPAIPFNRLLRPKAKFNLPPAEDGIHDPANDGTLALQTPQQGLAGFPASTFGNRVDWVQAVGKKTINPRYDRLDPTVAPVVMDLNIVREVKGSMPNVVYPHKQHTEWLDCSNCHPAIFIPQKGANQISMAAILLGQKCGVCHGKVAFPVSECRKCHSQKKDFAATPTSAKP